MSASVPKTNPEQTQMTDDTKPLAPVPMLHATFRWPEGPRAENTACPHCWKTLKAGQRAAVLDARFYQKGVSEGEIDESQLYGHALCVQEAARGGRGWFPLTTLA